MSASLHKNRLTTAFFLFGIALFYALGAAAILAAPTAPSRELLVAYAYPIDCMVVLPLLFYLLVIRRNGLSPLFVFPVLWTGTALALRFAQGSSTVVIAMLGTAVLIVEAIIAARETIRFKALFRAARASSDDPVDWFFAPLRQTVRSIRASKLAANELVMIYYALFSWKRSVQQQNESFTYHKSGGYTAFVAGMLLVAPVETIAVHLLVMQWNTVAAWVLTALSLYATLWLIADCRASAIRPIVIGENTLKIRSGLRFSVDVPLEKIAAQAKKPPHDEKKRLVNLGVMGSPCNWIVFTEPIEAETVFGKRRPVDAVGVSVDDEARFRRLLNEVAKLRRT